VKIALTATPSVARFAPILWRGGVAEAFELAAELGYDGVELHLRSPDDIELEAVRALQEKHGLGVPTIGTGMAAGEDGLTFTDPDPEIRQRAVARVAEHIRLAAVIRSAVTIGLIRGKLGADQHRGARRAAMLDCVQKCCRLAAAEGVTLFLEPLNRYEGDDLATLDQAAEMIRELNAPNLKLLADVYHMNIEEVDIAASLRRHAGVLGHVHLVDNNREVPGHGHVDMRVILQALLAIGYQGYVCFEVLPLPDARKAASDGIQTVRGILTSLMVKSQRNICACQFAQLPP
jgi:sugar phosphate isomerase/epimerase